MNTIKKTMMMTAAAALLIGSTGCFGSFSLTNKIYNFNKGVGDKFIQEIVFVAFVLVPVYQICAFGDVVIFNLLEFWTGSNPIALNPNQQEEMVVNYKGEEVKMVAKKNKMHLTFLTGKNKGEQATLNYNENQKVWTVEDGKTEHVFAKAK